MKRQEVKKANEVMNLKSSSRQTQRARAREAIPTSREGPWITPVTVCLPSMDVVLLL